MSSIMKKAVISAAAATAAVGFSMGPAAAASVTVSGGPSFTASSTNTVLTSASITMHCSSATMSGAVVGGSYTAPATIGSISSSTWSSCTAFGAPSSWTQSGTWGIGVTGASSGGVTPVQISGINLTISVPSLGCTLNASGSEAGTYDDADGALDMLGAPTIVIVVHGFCLGVGSTGSLTGSLGFVGSPLPISIS